MPNSTDPKFAIVIGGSAGVGRAVTDTLVSRGYHVGVIARGEDRLASLNENPSISTAAADAGDALGLRTAVDALIRSQGRPAVWVNCAMATSFSPFREMEIDEFDRIVRTTFLGQVNGTREALRTMTSGHIVHVGSGLAYRPVPFQSAYCASKHAINGFVGSLRSEIARENRDLSLSLVQLPAINTPQFTWARNRLSQKPQPAPPIFDPQVAADAVMRVIDKDIREILVGQSVFKLVFGDMALPGFLDRKMATSGAELQKSDRPANGDRPDNLFAPVDHPASATGAYSDRAKGSAAMIDADLARKLAFFGVPLVAFLIGLPLG